MDFDRDYFDEFDEGFVGWKDVGNVSDSLVSDFDNYKTVHREIRNFFEIILENSLFKKPFNHGQAEIDIDCLTPLEFGILSANEVDQSLWLESSSFNFFFWLNLNFDFFRALFSRVN